MFKISKQFLTSKMYHHAKNHASKIYLLLIYVLLTQNALAASVDVGDKTWGGLYGVILGLFTGTAGGIISVVAFIMGLLGAIFTQYKATSLVSGISIPLGVAFGPTIFVGLSGAVM